jgi:DNA-binding transcriptional MerR regulator
MLMRIRTPFAPSTYGASPAGRRSGASPLETGLVIPSARSQGGFRLYTETDVARLMVIRRMKPLGFTLEQMRDLLDATDRLDSGDALDDGEREALLERVRTYRRAAAEQVEKLRVQLERAEDFAATLGARLEQNVPAARV